MYWRNTPGTRVGPGSRDIFLLFQNRVAYRKSASWSHNEKQYMDRERKTVQNSKMKITVSFCRVKLGWHTENQLPGTPMKQCMEREYEEQKSTFNIRSRSHVLNIGSTYREYILCKEYKEYILCAEYKGYFKFF